MQIQIFKIHLFILTLSFVFSACEKGIMTNNFDQSWQEFIRDGDVFYTDNYPRILLLRDSSCAGYENYLLLNSKFKIGIEMTGQT